MDERRAQIDPKANPMHVDSEAVAWLRLTAWAILVSLWALWFYSLYFSMFLLFAFDSEVPTCDGAILGAIHGTWVAGIPVGLLIAGHVLANGRNWPTWRVRWIAVGVSALLWCAIMAFWIWASATDDPYAYHQISPSIPSGRSL